MTLPQSKCLARRNGQKLSESEVYSESEPKFRSHRSRGDRRSLKRQDKGTVTPPYEEDARPPLQRQRPSSAQEEADLLEAFHQDRPEMKDGRSRGKRTWETANHVRQDDHDNLQQKLRRRPAMGQNDEYPSVPPSPPQPEGPPPGYPAELPAIVGKMNLMVANWAIGENLCPEILCEKLTKSPFDLVLMVISSTVSDRDAIYQFLHEMAGERPYAQRPSVSDLMKDN